MQVNFNIINQKGSPAFYQDLYADIPNPGFPGRIFIGTDNFNIYRDTGTTWDLISGGGAVNPTNLFIPYVKAGDFSDSFLKNDDTTDRLISVYNGNETGIKLDFPNHTYYLGDFNNVNNGTDFLIDDDSGTIVTHYQGFEKGIKLDLINFVYYFGDFDDVNNGTYFLIDDTQLNFQFFNNSISNGLLVDFNKQWYKFGDWNAQANNTHFYIEDPNSRITWYSINAPRFDDLGSGNMISNSFFGPSGQYLVIIVNGTTYKIALLNP